MKTNPCCKYCTISQQDIIFFTLRGSVIGERRGEAGGKTTSAGSRPLEHAPAVDLYSYRCFLFFVNSAGKPVEFVQETRRGFGSVLAGKFLCICKCAIYLRYQQFYRQCISSHAEDHLLQLCGGIDTTQ